MTARMLYLIFVRQPVRHVHPALRGLERLPVTVASAKGK